MRVEADATAIHFPDAVYKSLKERAGRFTAKAELLGRLTNINGLALCMTDPRKDLQATPRSVCGPRWFEVQPAPTGGSCQK